jgi:hypothetical protein
MSYSAGTFHLIALLCTLAIEGSGMALWARLAFPHPWRALTGAIIANLIVHTLFWYAQPFLFTQWPQGLALAELLVVLVEGTIYAHVLAIPHLTPWLLSLTLNFVSLFLGLLLWQLIL